MWVLKQGYSSSSDTVRASLPQEIQMHPSAERLNEAPLPTLATTKQDREVPSSLHKSKKEEVVSKLNRMNV